MKYLKILLLTLIITYTPLGAMQEPRFFLEFEDSLQAEPLSKDSEDRAYYFEVPHISFEQQMFLLKQFTVPHQVLPIPAQFFNPVARLTCPWHNCKQKESNPFSLYHHMCENHVMLTCCFCEKIFPFTIQFIEHISSHGITLDDEYIKQSLSTNLGFLTQLERNKDNIHNNNALKIIKQWLEYTDFNNLKNIATLINSPFFKILPNKKPKRIIGPATTERICLWFNCQKNMKNSSIYHLYMHLKHMCRICKEEFKGIQSLQRHLIKCHSHAEAETAGLGAWFSKNTQIIRPESFLERYLLLMKEECQDSLKKCYGIDKNSKKTLSLNRLRTLQYIRSADGLSWDQIINKLDTTRQKNDDTTLAIFLSTDSLEGNFRCPWRECYVEGTVANLLGHIDKHHITFPCIICNSLLHPRDMLKHIKRNHITLKLTPEQKNWKNIFKDCNIQIPYFIIYAMIDQINDESCETLRINCQKNLSDNLIQKAKLLRRSWLDYYLTRFINHPYAPKFTPSEPTSFQEVTTQGWQEDDSSFLQSLLTCIQLLEGNNTHETLEQDCYPHEPFSPSAEYLPHQESSSSEPLEGRSESFIDLEKVDQTENFLS